MSTLFNIIKPATPQWQGDVPYNLDFDDIYFSPDNGYEESKYVFFDGNQLLARWQALAENRFIIAETGFGSGLNFLMAAQLWLLLAPKSARLIYYSCEQHPWFIADLLLAHQNQPHLKLILEELIKQYPPLLPGIHHVSLFDGRIELKLMFGDVLFVYNRLVHPCDETLQAHINDFYVDAWFLDGFAPAKNSAMWSQSFFQCMSRLSHKHTTFATFTAASIVREGLKSVGFDVLKIKGYGKKRHMLVGTKIDNPRFNKSDNKTPWYLPLKNFKKPIPEKVIIIGAGLAGCMLSREFANLGVNVSLLESKPSICRHGSQNQDAVLFPKVSAYDAPLTRFMLEAYLYAIDYYQNFPKFFNQTGMLLLESASDDLKALYQHAHNVCTPVMADRASELAGIDIDTQAMYFPKSGVIDIPDFCAYLIDHPLIRLTLNQPINALIREQQSWRIGDDEAPVVILCTGFSDILLPECQFLPLKTLAGQMTYIRQTDKSASINMPICASGHILPARDGVHAVGSTYHPGMRHVKDVDEDNERNLMMLKSMPIAKVYSEDVSHHWSSARVSTPDYLPVTGMIPEYHQFLSIYHPLSLNRNRYIKHPMPAMDGLYIFTALGSRGLTTAPLIAKHLSAIICNQPSLLTVDMQAAISPARFLHRDIIRMK